MRNFWREKQAFVCPGFFPTLNDKRGREERAWERGRFPDKLRKCCNCKSQYILVCRCLADSPYADVCFLVHGVAMPAHRVILTARSSYFAHMFMSKWRDRPLIELKHKLVRPSETLIVLEHLISVVSLFEPSSSSYFIYPRIFRVALTAYVSEHFNNTTAQWAKTRRQHRELRALLFAMSVWVL